MTGHTTTSEEPRDGESRPWRAPKRWLAALALVSLLGLSGCAALPFVGPSCGPGETDIGAIDGNVSEAEIKGEVRTINESAMVIDDGTGQATLVLTEDLTTQVSSGDCIIASGPAQEQSGRSREAVMIPTELYKEEIVVGEEEDEDVPPP